MGEGRHFPDYQWDVSHVGLVLVSKTEWPEEETARVAAKALINEWNLYLSGDVYCTVVEQFDGAFVPVDCDIVCGFYGEDFAKEELALMAGPS